MHMLVLESPKTLSLWVFLRLAWAQASRTQGFLSLLLLEGYINTSIHTYPVFARRINIVQRKRATQTYDKQKTSSDYTRMSKTLSAYVTLKSINLYRPTL